MSIDLKILMVDDHPIILEGYKKILLDNRSASLGMKIETAISCEEANTKLEASLRSRIFDIIFLDIGLAPSKDGKFLSGEDVGRKIREVSPDSKLAVLTMFAENLRLLTIFKNLKPEAFMVKSDVSSSEFLEAFDNMLQGRSYSSQTVQDLMRKQIVNDYDITKTDREILLHLSKGLKSKDIPKVVPLSLASVEKRKKFMREIFEVEDTRDITLLNRAKELGFL